MACQVELKTDSMTQKQLESHLAHGLNFHPYHKIFVLDHCTILQLLLNNGTAFLTKLRNMCLSQQYNKCIHDHGHASNLFMRFMDPVVISLINNPYKKVEKLQFCEVYEFVATRFVFHGRGIVLESLHDKAQKKVGTKKKKQKKFR